MSKIVLCGGWKGKGGGEGGVLVDGKGGIGSASGVTIEVKRGLEEMRGWEL